jgi:hypothetical protein
MLPGDEPRGTTDLLYLEGFAQFRRVMCEHSQSQEQPPPRLPRSCDAGQRQVGRSQCSHTGR